jgi:hypothetical protein
VSAVVGQAPTISKPEGTPPSELTTKDIIVGTGAEVLAYFNIDCSLHLDGMVNRKDH